MIRLYRPQLRGDGADASWTYFDAVADEQEAIAFAKELKRKNPDREVRVDAEDWPGLGRISYHWYRLTKVSEGFGSSFMNQRSQRISAIETIWTA